MQVETDRNTASVTENAVWRKRQDGNTPEQTVRKNFRRAVRACTLSTV